MRYCLRGGHDSSGDEEQRSGDACRQAKGLPAQRLQDPSLLRRCKEEPVGGDDQPSVESRGRIPSTGQQPQSAGELNTSLRRGPIDEALESNDGPRQKEQRPKH